MDDKTRTELEAAAFRRLVQHLRERTDVQNIDLMNLAGFCRNCLSRWYREAAEAAAACRSPIPKRARSSTACPMTNGRRSIRRKRARSRRKPSIPPINTSAAAPLPSPGAALAVACGRR